MQSEISTAATFLTRCDYPRPRSPSITSKNNLPTESLELVQNDGVAACNSGKLVNVTFSKYPVIVSQCDNKSQSTISNGCYTADEISRSSRKGVCHSEIDSISDWREDLNHSPRLEFAMESRFKRSGEQMLSTFFENECFRIQRSQTAGLGAVAIRNLKEGDVILRERPLFTANASNVFEAYEKLTGRDKDVAMSLHANALLKPGTPRIQAVWKTNCFAVTDTVAGLFPVASRFNHACHPSQNVHFSFDRNSGLLILSIRAKHVAEGEELKVSYGIDRTPEDLYHLYGFICQCGTCSGRHPTVLGLEW